ncbi:hypothetical protein TNCV_78221 [Trichonephila clavipes]|nr:hypothetical protein TNCV_78221 [Trichonephila clavipes]
MEMLLILPSSRVWYCLKASALHQSLSDYKLQLQVYDTIDFIATYFRLINSSLQRHRFTSQSPLLGIITASWSYLPLPRTITSLWDSYHFLAPEPNELFVGPCPSLVEINRKV